MARLIQGIATPLVSTTHAALLGRGGVDSARLVSVLCVACFDMLVMC